MYDVNRGYVNKKTTQCEMRLSRCFFMRFSSRFCRFLCAMFGMVRVRCRGRVVRLGRDVGGDEGLVRGR